MMDTILKRGTLPKEKAAQVEPKAEPVKVPTVEDKLAAAKKEQAFREQRYRDLGSELTALRTKARDMRTFFESARSAAIADGLVPPTEPGELTQAERRIRDVESALPVAAMKLQEAKNEVAGILQQIWDGQFNDVMKTYELMRAEAADLVKRGLNIFALLDRPHAHDIARTCEPLGLKCVPWPAAASYEFLLRHLPRPIGQRNAWEGYEVEGLTGTSREDVENAYSGEGPVVQ